jgi:hypothetical protein
MGSKNQFRDLCTGVIRSYHYQQHGKINSKFGIKKWLQSENISHPNFFLKNSLDYSTNEF